MSSFGMSVSYGFKAFGQLITGRSKRASDCCSSGSCCCNSYRRLSNGSSRASSSRASSRADSSRGSISSACTCDSLSLEDCSLGDGSSRVHSIATCDSRVHSIAASEHKQQEATGFSVEPLGESPIEIAARMSLFAQHKQRKALAAAEQAEADRVAKSVRKPLRRVGAPSAWGDMDVLLSLRDDPEGPTLKVMKCANFNWIPYVVYYD